MTSHTKRLASCLNSKWEISDDATGDFSLGSKTFFFLYSPTKIFFAYAWGVGADKTTERQRRGKER